MIKRLRRFANTTILCITDNVELKDNLQEKFTDAKALLFFDTFEAVKESDEKYDVMLLDYSTKNALEILKNMHILKPLLPKIALLEKRDREDILDCINGGVYSMLAVPVDFESLRLSIITALNRTKRVDKVCLRNGVYYDAYRERFYDENDVIKFTNLEFALLKLLLENHDRIVSYDEIKEKVWKEKKMSIFTMRNVINKIRKKTYYEIIKNNSSAGYQIDPIQ